jgi:hypothetical protein
MKINHFALAAAGAAVCLAGAAHAEDGVENGVELLKEVRVRKDGVFQLR